jgi:hypothetical protein
MDDEKFKFNFPKKEVAKNEAPLDDNPKFEFPAHLIGTTYISPLVATPTILPRVTRVSLEGKVGSRVDPTKYRGNGHWQFDEPLGTDKQVGFIYVIRDILNEKLYLGKKQFKGLGRENKGEDSNWRWYISSSKELSASIKTNGKDSFEFVAIEQYRSKGAVSYAETWSLMHVESPVNRHMWYNLLVNKVSWVVKEPITQKHKDRLHMMCMATQIKYK